MKKSLIIFTLLGSLLLGGCEEGCGGDPPLPYDTYNFENASGYTLTIIHRPSCVELPDYLTLQPDEIYRIDESETIQPGMKSFFDTDRYNIFDVREIHYDNRYVIDFNDLRYARKPQNKKNYEKRNTDDSGERKYVFTFTPEDYQYAVEHGTVLEEKE